MKNVLIMFAIMFVITIFSCGDDEPTINQSDRCNNGAKATLTITIDGVGTFNYEESSAAVSHATDTEGGGIDALSMFIRWPDSGLGTEVFFDVSIENEDLAEVTYTYNAANFNGTVNFYIDPNGANEHYTFSDWTTTINEFEEYSTTSAGGFTTTRLAFVSATTSGTLELVGGTTSHVFTATYTICPEY